MNENFKIKIFHFVNALLIVLLLVTIIFPLWNIVVLSFNDAADAAAGGIYLWPRVFTLDNYIAVLNDPALLHGFVVSVLKTLVGVVTHVAFTAMVAYAVSKNDLWGRNVFVKMGIITMYISGGLIPTFLLYSHLGLINSFAVYIIPALFSFYDLILMMNFFREIPDSLEESARIDGASDFTIFVKIILPLSLPILATIALFNGVYQWNDYMTTKLYVTNEALYPVQYYLYQMITQADGISQAAAKGVPVGVQQSVTSESMQLAAMVITTLPIVMIYPFLQKYFVKGLTLGSVK